MSVIAGCHVWLAKYILGWDGHIKLILIGQIFFTPPTPFKKIPPKVWQTPEHLIYQQTGWGWDCGVGRRPIVCLLSLLSLYWSLSTPQPHLIIKQTFPSLKTKGLFNTAFYWALASEYRFTWVELNLILTFSIVWIELYTALVNWGNPHSK